MGDFSVNFQTGLGAGVGIPVQDRFKHQTRFQLTLIPFEITWARNAQDFFLRVSADYQGLFGSSPHDHIFRGRAGLGGVWDFLSIGGDLHAGVTQNRAPVLGADLHLFDFTRFDHPGVVLGYQALLDKHPIHQFTLGLRWAYPWQEKK